MSARKADIKINIIGDRSKLAKLADDFRFEAIAQIVKKADEADRDRIIDFAIECVNALHSSQTM